MSALVFMDTETTGLSLDDDIWEFAAIRREEDGTEQEYHLFVEHDRKKCAQLPVDFRSDHYDRYLDHRAYTKSQAASTIAGIFRNGKPHVVGAVPNFDTERIAKFCRDNGALTPSWHYHLIDVETLAIGCLAANAISIPLPCNSDDVSRAVGIEPPTTERHTAMGDARWAMALYDAITADKRPVVSS